jgi:2-iminobutanoate/2-iminopropanoate deaminase
MKKVVVNNDKAPNLNKIFNWGLKISDFNEIFLVSGHGAMLPDFEVACPGDPAGQARFIFSQVEAYLKENDYCLDDVIQIKQTITKDVTDEQFHEIVAVYEEFMSGVAVKPSGGTMRVVDRLVVPGMMVEFEFMAAK